MHQPHIRFRADESRLNARTPKCYRRGMAFEPDIIITGPDAWETVIVVKVTTDPRLMEETERQLKHLMGVMNSPLGLLVTPERLWLYRDRYLSLPEESIARIGDFDVKSVFKLERAGKQMDALAFEEFVQSWIEDLSTEYNINGLPPDLRRAIRAYIVPAVEQGQVRAGHFRTQLTT